MRRRILLGTLAVSAVSLLTGLFASGVVRRDLIQDAQTELTRQAAVTAQIIEAEIRGSVPDDRAAIRRTIERVRLVGGHDYLEAGVVTATGLRPLNARAVLLPMIPDDVATDTRLELEVEGEPVLATVSTIEVGRFVFLIAIGRGEPLLDARFLTGPLIAGLAIGGLLSVGLAYLLAHRLGRRLEGLEDAARAVADGDYAARAPVEGDDDLARLGESFNEMAARIQTAQDRERDFLMSVGHDLRTPLTTIRGYAEGLDAGDIDSGDLPRVARVLHTQTDRLSRLVEDLMLLARLESREFQLRPEWVDVAAHLAELVTAEEERARQLGIRIEAASSSVGSCLVDPDRLGQIVANLLDNAFRYTPEGGVVEVSLVDLPGAFEVSVTDRGPGIDPEDLPRVFDRLFVAQRYRPLRPEGSGLGLSIVRELAYAMGGHVDVESAPGKGTMVRVRLPRGRSDSSGLA